MNRSLTLTIISIGLLAGCSSTNGPVGPESESLGVVPVDFEISYNSGTNEVTLGGGATVTVLSERSFYDGDSFLGYQNTTGDGQVAIYAVTPSEGGFASVAVRNNGVIGASAFGRNNETNLPAGSADFSGEYGAWLVMNSGQTFSLIYGDADLLANFDTGSISGAITNRANFISSAESYADVTLVAGTLSGGAFSGTTTGGSGDGTNITTAANGSYNGLIVGPNGEELVGAVVIEHSGSTDVTEYGAFIGN